MPYAGQDFGSMDTNEAKFLGFNFAPYLNTGDTIVSGSAVMSVSVGTDAAAASHVSAVVIQTTNVSTLVSGLVSGVRYKLQINVVTTSGETLALWAFLGTIG